MKVALVHDWLLGLGGAERVLKVLHEMFPEAPIYTFFYNKKFTDKFLPGTEIKSSFLQKIYKLKIINHKFFLPLLPVAVESFDLSMYDLVISSSIAFSKGLVLKPKTKHICYCYSPTRFLWDWTHEHGQKSQKIGSGIVRHFLRIWDRSAADRVDRFVAISKNIQQRIKKYYNRDSVVIYPPINNFQFPISNFQSISNASIFKNSDIKKFNKNSKLKIKNSAYYLIVSRLFPHKNIDIAIQAFNKLELPLVIVGDGPEKKRLQRLATPNADIEFAGNISDENLIKYYQSAKAFIMPQEEDFGLTPLEAMQFGKPVLALKRGGALEYILEGINGEFFEDPHPAVLADGVRRLNENYENYSSLVIKKTAERFTRQRFEEEFKSLLSIQIHTT